MMTILVLGAGTGGIITACELHRRTSANVKILLFEKAKRNDFEPALLWLMVGKREKHQVFRHSYKLNRKRTEVVFGKVENIQPENVSINIKDKKYSGDFMVVALGADFSDEHQLLQFGHNFYSLSGANSFYNKLNNFNGGRIAILISSLPFKCPAAPYEAAMLIESYIRKKGLKNKTEISIYSPETQPMPVAGKELGMAVKKMLEQKGINYFTEYQITSANQQTLTFSNGKIAEYDLLAFTPKHIPPQGVRESPLAGKNGWIEVNRNTLETKFQNVFAIGDNTVIPLESGKSLPKAGVFAHYQAETVAHNIAMKISGKKKFKTFNGNGQCFLETGDGKAGFASGNFYASPEPVVKMRNPGFWWHWKKVWFEKYWWYKYFYSESF